MQIRYKFTFSYGLIFLQKVSSFAAGRAKLRTELVGRYNFLIKLTYHYSTAVNRKT